MAHRTDSLSCDSDTAHGINFHPTAPMAYAQIISFLGNHTL